MRALVGAAIGLAVAWTDPGISSSRAQAQVVAQPPQPRKLRAKTKKAVRRPLEKKPPRKERKKPPPVPAQRFVPHGQSKLQSASSPSSTISAQPAPAARYEQLYAPTLQSSSFSAPPKGRYAKVKHARQRLTSTTSELTSLLPPAARFRPGLFRRQRLRGQRFQRQHLVASTLTRSQHARGTDYVVQPAVQRQVGKKVEFHFTEGALIQQKFVPLPTNLGRPRDDDR